MGDDVGVVERGRCLGFKDEPLFPIEVGDLVGGQHLQCGEAIEASVARLVHLAHSASAEGGNDLVRTQAGAGSKGQGVAPDYTSTARGSRASGSDLNSTWGLGARDPARA